MKALPVLSTVLPAIAALAACSAPEASTINTGFSEDNLASSEACFAETPSTLLEPGQTLLETGPAGITRVSWSLGDQAGDVTLSISGMELPVKTRLDAANAAFYSAAGQQHDHSTDAVIYHRTTDGTFCTVIRDEPTGQALVDAITALSSDPVEPQTSED
ncbi:hypothetical protein Mmar10_0035 [Maricaulis maris MCS10]|uniref:Lipoprotein n=1 Tax=Maricaulis maris (strain MCS10) TaxID=394221 RepID=Q0ATQ6_MARMM|nr:hypothetical protein [Maricaulis maris]ABI64331.1 hypothetical protein Mmar10_0035 [Maricaulis maris MCS10]